MVLACPLIVPRKLPEPEPLAPHRRLWRQLALLDVFIGLFLFFRYELNTNVGQKTRSLTHNVIGTNIIRSSHFSRIRRSTIAILITKSVQVLMFGSRSS